MYHHRSSCFASAPLLLLIHSFLLASFFDTADRIVQTGFSDLSYAGYRVFGKQEISSAREHVHFIYVNNMGAVSLEYALLTSNKTVVSDGSNSYRNVFFLLLDTVYAALEKSRAGSVKIVVSETGWPTSGGTAASMDNARTYVNNLIRIVKTGSPRRPELPIETYLLLDFDVSFQNNC